MHVHGGERWTALGLVAAILMLGAAILTGSQTEQVTAQTDTTLCTTVVRDALREVGSNCDHLSRNSACYGFNQVRGTFTQVVPANFFTRPADRGELSIFERIQTSALNLQNNIWGIALMSVQANLPQTLPGQSVIFMLVGDTQVENAVPPGQAFMGGMISAVVTRIPAALYADPSTSEPVVANVPAGVTLQADAITQSGDWVRVVYDGQPGWLMVNVIDAPNGLNLPVYTPRTRTPMQAFYFRTGIGSLECLEAPDTLIVQGPRNLRVNINANGAEMQLGSTVALSTLPIDPRSLRLLFPDYTGRERVGALMQVTTLDGVATIYPGTEDEVVVRAGETAVTCLPENRNLGIDGVANDRRVIPGCGWLTRDLEPSDLDSLVELEGFELLYPITLPLSSAVPQAPPFVPPSEPPTAIFTPTIMLTPSLTPTFAPNVTDLNLFKTVDNSNPAVGALVEFTVTLTSFGPDNATGVVVNDLLPPGLVYASHVVSAGSYNAATGVWTVGNVNIGTNYTLTLRATVVTNPPGTVLTNNAAIASLDQTDPVGGNNSASASVTVSAADLAISKDVSNLTPLEGETVVYTITVENLGPHPANGIIVNEPLAAGLDYASHTQTQGSYAPGTGVWTVGALGVGQSASLTITVEVLFDTGGTLITNTASITGSSLPDPNSGNNSASATIEPVNAPEADLSITKIVSDDTPLSGDFVLYTVTVYNGGPDPATSVTVSDLLEPGQSLLTVTPTQGAYNPITGVWEVGGLGVDANATLTIFAQITAPPGTIINNTAEITASTPVDPNTVNNSESVTLTVAAPTADLGVSKTVDDPTPIEGQPIVYTVTLTHNSGDPVNGVQVEDNLPGQVTYVTHSASQGTYNPGTGIWDVGSLDALDAVTLTINVTINSGTVGQTITNTATIINNGWTDPITTNNQASVDVVVQPSCPSFPTFVSTTAELIVAINLANDETCFPGQNTIGLSTTTFIVTDAVDFSEGPSAFPAITSDVVINGGGAIFSKSGPNNQRYFYVATGGTLTINNVANINDGSTNGSANGGAFLSRGSLTLNSVSIQGGLAVGQSGGGIANYGTLTLNNVSIYNGNAANGGGIFNDGGTVTINESQIFNNSAANGGGIFNNTGSASIARTTISGNGGGGSGIQNSGTMSILNSTISGNTGAGLISSGSTNVSFSTIAGNGGNGYENVSGTLSFKNSIIAANSSDCSGGVPATLGVNLVSSAACPDPIFTISGTINLGALANNGGTNQTHAIDNTSSAYNAAPDCTDIGGNSVTFDQRGVGRPQDGVCDVGSFELQP